MTTKLTNPLLSVVVPLYNESAGLAVLHDALEKVLQHATHGEYEIVYCDDGSTDNTSALVRAWHTADSRAKLVVLSRNFGKEIATSAGIHAAHGAAILMIDADGQHPVELIPEFLAKWQAGSKVVVGVRTNNQKEGLVKRYGSKWFYRLFNRFTGMKLIPGSSDFRLIDRSVQQEFVRLTERNRITRGLIDWLGYQRDYIEFTANPRLIGESGYSFRKLFKLAVDSVISLSISPLYITAYIGAFVLPLSVLLGLGMVINLLFGDPLHLHATGGAYVMILVLFLVGVLLVSQGIIGLYLSHIHTETQNRPLYVIDKAKSLGLDGEV
jgi:glycosyltransferase involved in cell wall biosynthesis